MLKLDSNYVASKLLRKLENHYLGDDVEEIAMNRPGSVWVRKRGEDWEEFPAPELSYDYIFRVCKVLANINNVRFSEDSVPIMACEMPGAPYRFQAVIGPNVRYELSDRKGVALAVRSLRQDSSVDFGSYGLVDGADLPGASAKLREFEMLDDHVEMIRRVIASHESIIVSGATSTGKTTFVNRVIEIIPRNHRIITVEDARELHVPHRNRVHLIVPRTRSANEVGYPEVIDSLVRLTPDWIICGELSVANAQPIHAVMGKGHPVITTVHAGTPDEAMEAFANNMSMAGAGAGFSAEGLKKSIESQIGAIIQLEKRDGIRRVVEIDFPSRRRDGIRN